MVHSETSASVNLGIRTPCSHSAKSHPFRSQTSVLIPEPSLLSTFIYTSFGPCLLSMDHKGQPISKPTAITLCLVSVYFMPLHTSSYLSRTRKHLSLHRSHGMTYKRTFKNLRPTSIDDLSTTYDITDSPLHTPRSLAHRQVYYDPLPFQTLPSVSSITYLPSPRPNSMMSSGRIIMPGSQPSLPELLNAAHRAAYWCVRSSTCCGSEVPWMMERIFTAPSSSMSLRIV